jgi:hypothetical protein
MHSIAFVEPKPVTTVQKNLPYQVHNIIARCLKKDREERYPDARALAADLKRLRIDLESGTRLSLPPLQRLQGWFDRLRASFPYGNRGFVIAVVAVVLTVVLFFSQIQWANMFGPAMIAFFIYRAIRGRKKRLLQSLAKKVSAFPEVKAVFIRNEQVTIVLDRAPAKTYIKINALIEAANRRIHFGKPFEAALRDDLTEPDFQNLLRTTGLVFARKDVMLGTPISKA